MTGPQEPGRAARDDILATVQDDVGRRLRLYADLLVRWQATINLVAPSSIPDLWTRHIGDSLQVQAAAPTARRWVDFGSGGGFPGLVTAILLADQSAAIVHLVESDKRKAVFLRNVSRETGLNVTVHCERVETFVPNHAESVDAVSARALAPLRHLLALADKFLLAGAIGIFPKGQQVAAELTEVGSDRRFTFETVTSRSDPRARLVIVKAVSVPHGSPGD